MKRKIFLILLAMVTLALFACNSTQDEELEGDNPPDAITHTVTWINYDGTILSTQTVEDGNIPVYGSSYYPQKDTDGVYTYEFSGWIPKIQPIYADTKYVAQFDSQIIPLEVVSSHESGFFNDNFDLSLQTRADAQIYYTLDSSTPDLNSSIYKGPIEISDNSGNPNVYSAMGGISSLDVFMPTELVDKCTVLKAIAVDENGNKSKLICKTFFVGYQEKEGYSDIPIISLSLDPSDLFDYETGIYVTGKIYDEQEHSGYPETYPANYQQKGKDWEREAEFVYFESDQTFSFAQTIGVRIHGGWSRAFNQKSFNLYARKEYSGSKTFEKPFFDTEKMQSCMLRSGGYRDTFVTKARDSLNQELSKNESFSVQNSMPCILFLNGEYWGI